MLVTGPCLTVERMIEISISIMIWNDVIFLWAFITTLHVYITCIY